MTKIMVKPKKTSVDQETFFNFYKIVNHLMIGLFLLCPQYPTSFSLNATKVFGFVVRYVVGVAAFPIFLYEPNDINCF
jgi:hypothetical protein